LFLGQCDECLHIISVGDGIALLVATLDTAMHEYIAWRGTFKAHRLHKCLAERCAVAGIDVDMLAPQTLRAVIGIAITFDEHSAMLAEKILYSTLEFFVWAWHVATLL